MMYLIKIIVLVGFLLIPQYVTATIIAGFPPVDVSAPPPPEVYTEAHYVIQIGAGTQDGRSLANAWSVANFNNIANWSTNNSVDNKIGPGDVVYFHGTFTDRVIVTGGGSSAGSITLDGYEAGETNPIVSVNTGAALLSQGMDVGNGVAGPGYLTIQDFRMTRNNSANSCFTMYAKVGGTESEKYIHHTIIRRNYVYQTNGTMFYWYGGRYNIIEGNKFFVFGQNGTNAVQGATFIQLDHSVITGNEFGHDEDTYPSGCTSAEMVELHGCQNLLVEYNNIYGAPQQAGLRPKEWARKMENIVIRFNKIHNNSGSSMGTGMHLHTRDYQPISDFYIYGNYVFNNATHNLQVGTGVSNVYVWANILSNGGRGGVSTWRTTDHPFNLYFYNNTFARNNTRAESDVNRGGIVIGAGTSTISIKNNLFFRNRPAGESSQYNQIYSSVSINSIEHNHYHHNLGVPTVYYSGGYRTLATLQSTYNFEDDSPAGSITDPLFVSPAGSDGVFGTEDDDYRLSASSPLIGAGKTLTGLFSVNLSGGDSWFETASGYSTLSFGLDDALDPVLTDWETNPPTVVSAKQGSYGNWEPGAYVYRVE